ncbi:hypothetical protein K502DRAFT_164031 [Neoconidiobolus thromboides FSU 785]|nr:hypothetical protein K502DRAFT_164031 [Neoconidiobolus thromboides FSU 785]
MLQTRIRNNGLKNNNFLFNLKRSITIDSNIQIPKLTELFLINDSKKKHLDILQKLENKKKELINQSYIEHLKLVKEGEREGEVEEIWNHYNSTKVIKYLDSVDLTNLLIQMNKSCEKDRVSRVLRIIKDYKLSSKEMNIQHYEQLMYSFASTNRFEECWILLNEMKEKQMDLNDKILVILIQKLGKESRTLTSIKLLKLISQNLSSHSDKVKMALLMAFVDRKDASNLKLFLNLFDLSLPSFILNKIIAFFVNQNRMIDAEEIMEKYRNKTGNILDENLFITMGKGYLKNNDLEKTKNSYNQFIKLGGVPSTQFQSQLITVCLKRKEINNIDRILNQIPLNQLNFIHGNCFVNFLILKYCPLMPDYFLLLNKIDESEVNVELKVLAKENLIDSIIKYLCEEKELELATKLIKELKEKKIYSIKSYHQLMSSYYKSNKEEIGLLLIQDIKQLQLPLTSYTFEIGFKLLSQTLNLNSTLDLFNYSKEMEVTLTMNSIEYIMRILNLNKEYLLLVETFLDIIETETYPTVDLINIIIKEYILNQQYEQVIKFFLQLNQQGITPQLKNFAYLIHNLIQSNQHLEIENSINLMIKYNIKGDLPLYTQIINYYLKKQDLNMVQSILLKLKKEGLLPNKILYSVLTRGFIKVGKLSLAKEIFLQMEKQNIQLDLINYTSLIGRHMFKGGLSDVYKFLELLSKLNLKKDGILHSILLENIQNHLGTAFFIAYFKNQEKEFNEFNEPYQCLIKNALNNKELFEFLKEVFINNEDKWDTKVLENFAYCCAKNKDFIEFDKIIEKHPQLLESKRIIYFIKRN